MAGTPGFPVTARFAWLAAWMARLLAILLVLPAAPAAAQKLDAVPRTVVMTAFPPEWAALVEAVDRPVEYQVNGLTLLAGTMAGKPVLLVQSGVSMVNAAMNTQLVLDRFAVRRILFSGIAGGVDPALDIGDVVVPDRWTEYLEVSLARAMPGGGWQPPEPVDPEAPANLGMMFPRGVRVGNAEEPAARHYYFAADPTLLAVARTVAAGVVLQRCLPAVAPAAPHCLDRDPRVLVGGTGVSGSAFADNGEVRDYLFRAYGARVLDMESAAVAQVGYANRVPVIAFRSLSDLAGGDAGANRMTTFMALASVNSARVVRAFLAALPD